MKYINVRNLEKYNPGYKDRSLIWCKIYFNMINSDPDFELLDEIDKWRFIALIMLQLQSKKPTPVSSTYLSRKGFDLKKKPISKTIENLSVFLEVHETNSVTQDSCERNETVTQSRVDKSRVDKSRVEKCKHLDFVMLSENETEKLFTSLGKERFDSYVYRLNNYIGSKGKQYKSHYHTILNWVERDKSSVTESVSPRKKFANHDKIIESRLSNIATKDMIKSLMREVPDNMWWKIEKYLNKRYPSGGNGFNEAEREVIKEKRDNLGKIDELTGSVS